ncbi:cation-efflux pump FieF [Oceanibaculum pacificum]|uniref:Cation-efflux pump FieF n=2 Tax=Oceanibaculum pacificum TaxID=580166 RepID=A0A154W9W7_9PROT|nr:cation-efflux pump FieF [Oceanibaculum pacificum]
MRRATRFAVIAALILIVVKFAAWLMTDSVALLSSLIDSALDAFASLVNLLAIRQALVPPDREHRFGHGKAEPLAALAQSAFITGSAIFLLIEAARRLWQPQPTSQEGVGIAVMMFSIAVTVGLVAYQAHVVRRTSSLAITADSLHYKGDLLINVSIIVSLVLSGWFGVTLADPVFALGIAGYLIFTAWGILREALDMLMDRELPADERQAILDIVRREPAVLGVHDLRTRSAGQRRFVQMHLELDGAMSLKAAHDIADSVEAAVEAAFPAAEVIVHQDPFGIPDKPR